MNGIEKISEKILADAADKAAAILGEANASAKEIEDAGVARVEQETAAAREAAAAKAADIAEKARQASAMNHNKLLQSERQAIIGEAFDAALERLLALPSAEYQALLVSLVKRAVADGEGGELLLNEKDRAKYGEAVLKEVNAALMGGKLEKAGDVVKGAVDQVLQGEMPKVGQVLSDATSAALGNKLLTLAEDAVPIVGGVVVRRGRIELNCALDVIVRMLSEQVAVDVSHALFGKGA